MDPVFRTVVILCLSVLFVSAASHKLRHRALFQGQLEAYGLVPQPLIGVSTYMLALLELALAAALLVPFMAAFALRGAALMLIFYGLVMEIAIWRGRGDIDCGCGTVEGSASISNNLVLRNLILSAVASAAALPVPDSVLSWIDLCLCVLVAGTCTAFYQASNQLMANWPSLKMWRTN